MYSGHRQDCGKRSVGYVRRYSQVQVRSYVANKLGTTPPADVASGLWTRILSAANAVVPQHSLRVCANSTTFVA